MLSDVATRVQTLERWAGEMERRVGATMENFDRRLGHVESIVYASCMGQQHTQKARACSRVVGILLRSQARRWFQGARLARWHHQNEQLSSMQQSVQRLLPGDVREGTLTPPVPYRPPLPHKGSTKCKNVHATSEHELNCER